MFKRNKSVSMSVPEPMLLHGIEVKKLPIGRYIKLMQYAEDFLPDMLIKLFPGSETAPIVLSFQALSAEGLRELLAKAVSVIPEELCKMLDILLDIPAQRLLDPDEGLTPVQLMEILVALWEANDLSDFFPLARKLRAMAGLSAMNTGSSAG